MGVDGGLVGAAPTVGAAVASGLASAAPVGPVDGVVPPHAATRLSPTTTASITQDDAMKVVGKVREQACKSCG